MARYWSGILATMAMGSDHLFWPANHNNNISLA